MKCVIKPSVRFPYEYSSALLSQWIVRDLGLMAVVLRTEKKMLALYCRTMMFVNYDEMRHCFTF